MSENNVCYRMTSGTTSEYIVQTLDDAQVERAVRSPPRSYIILGSAQVRNALGKRTYDIMKGALLEQAEIYE